MYRRKLLSGAGMFLVMALILSTTGWNYARAEEVKERDAQAIQQRREARQAFREKQAQIARQAVEARKAKALKEAQKNKAAGDTSEQEKK